MSDFRVGYLYSLSPVHCGGEGDLGNILEIAREVHTNFPYIPGSTLRGNIRDELESIDETIAEKLFGRKLDDNGQMGVHQVWFGDARILWIPMRTMSHNNQDVFTWVSCHSLIRDHALIAHLPPVSLPNCAVGTSGGLIMWQMLKLMLLLSQLYLMLKRVQSHSVVIGVHLWGIQSKRHGKTVT